MRLVIDAARGGVKRAAHGFRLFLKVSSASTPRIAYNHRPAGSIFDQYFKQWHLGVRDMWRFIIMTFAFLGWSFYTISGGADYQPREDSRQAAALKAEAERKLAALSPNVVASVAPKVENTDEVTRNAIDLTEMLPGKNILQQPVRVLSQRSEPVETVQTPYQDKRLASLSLAQPAAFAQAAGMAPVSPENAPTAQQDLRDLRHITGTSVNMRTGPGTGYAVFARVIRDTDVEVLETFENGWLRLRVIENSKVGWVHSTLVSAKPVSDDEG
ncbi:MAG: SH3 domain-containing protein [Paracoccaceae bacterium]|jgi:hypothetical protein|nr:SH3 domain-containing protein [Paracoccaceae bacterium]